MCHGTVSTNPYRAPEVTLGNSYLDPTKYTITDCNTLFVFYLGLKWSSSVDGYSVGCILAEIYLGRQLFSPTRDAMERLACIQRVYGPWPPNFYQSANEHCPGVFLPNEPRINYPHLHSDPKTAPPNIRNALDRIESHLPLCVSLTTVLYAQSPTQKIHIRRQRSPIHRYTI